MQAEGGIEEKLPTKSIKKQSDRPTKYGWQFQLMIYNSERMHSLFA